MFGQRLMGFIGGFFRIIKVRIKLTAAIISDMTDKMSGELLAIIVDMPVAIAKSCVMLKIPLIDKGYRRRFVSIAM